MNYFLLGQILLCILIILIIVFFSNTIYRDDLNEAKQLMLDSEVEKMKEDVKNMMTNIDLRRESAQQRVSELIDICVTETKENRYKDAVQSVKGVMNFMYGTDMGNAVQVIMDDGHTCTLLNFEHKDGIQISRHERDNIMGQEAIQRSLIYKDMNICYFAFQTDIDELVKAEIYHLIHSLEYSEDSYIWVNEILNMEGGDDYAIRRIHPNLQKGHIFPPTHRTSKEIIRIKLNWMGSEKRVKSYSNIILRIYPMMRFPKKFLMQHIMNPIIGS